MKQPSKLDSKDNKVQHVDFELGPKEIDH